MDWLAAIVLAMVFVWVIGLVQRVADHLGAIRGMLADLLDRIPEPDDD